MKHRTATVARKTRETRIEITLDLDGTGKADVATGVGFLDHMLELFAKHSLCDLAAKCEGDVRVDYHHTVFLLPMDESLCQCALDFGGRPFLAYSTECTATFVRDFDTRLFEEFFRALSVNARMNLHLRHTGGNEAHHAAESVFKAFARSVRAAVERDPREPGIPSSKGAI